MCTSGIVKGEGNNLLIFLVLALVFMVNAGYGGGFSNVPTLLSDHYGMGSISAIHGITLSAWGFAGLTGNQLASYIVEHTGKMVPFEHDGVMEMINPQGYQNVLIATGILYVIALLVCFILVRPSGKAAEAKAAKKKAKAEA